MRHLIAAFICLFVVFGCKEKKIDLSGKTPVKANDFISAFPTINLPYSAADSNITKIDDSTRIGIKVLEQFIPDSILDKQLNITEKSIIHPVGKIEKETERYLLTTSTTNKKTDLAVFVLDKKNKYLAFKSLITNGQKDGYVHSVFINKEPTFSINRDKMNHEKQQLQYTRIGWAYTSSTGKFINVVNETNEDEKRNNTVINPIDTLPRKNKFSGNYVQDNKNFISLRDGKTPNTYFFFIHFEKNEGSCTGELKGELKMKSSVKGIYTDNSNPCVMDFTFNGNEIIVKEQGSCGNYRGIKCYFNDSYTKKKDPLIKKKK
jgi:hypothetical protein